MEDGSKVYEVVDPRDGNKVMGRYKSAAWALKKIKGMGFKVEASNVPEEMLAGVA